MRRLLPARWIERALTRVEYREVGRGKKIERVELPPSERLVLGIQFALAALALLTGMQLAHLFVLHAWSSEVFTVISGLIGTVIGVFLAQK